MIDWLLFVLLLGAIVMIGWGAYQVGKEEGWREAGRWADDYLPEAESRPASRDDDEPLGV